MNFERYTEKLKQAIQLAQSLAIAGQNQFITPLHLFAAMEEDDDKLIICQSNIDTPAAYMVYDKLFNNFGKNINDCD